MWRHHAQRFWVINLAAVLCLGVGVSSCEEVIESPFELVESKLVIASTFAPHLPVTVQLTATQPITGEISFLEVTDAMVSLFEGPELIETLHYEPADDGNPGVYTTRDFHPTIGHKYTLHALADGFTPVTAESSIPTNVAITSLAVTNISVRSMLDREVYDYLLTVNYDDPVEEGNFYDLRISQEVTPFRVSILSDTFFYEPVLKSVFPANGGLNVEPIIGGQASVLLRDKENDQGVSVQLQSIIDPSEEKLGSIFAELRTVSAPYYLFQANLQPVGSVAGGVIEPRVNSYTNVTAGYGIFAGYNSSTTSYAIK